MLFQGSRDLKFWQRTNRELYKRFMIKAQVFLYDRNQPKNDLYGETTDLSFNQATSKASYEIEAYFEELPEWKAKLMKFGLDEERPLKAYFFALSFEELQAAHPELTVVPPGVGDRIVVEGEPYKVMKDNPRDYFLNTQTALTHSVTMIRARPESVESKPRPVSSDQQYPFTGPAEG